MSSIELLINGEPSRAVKKLVAEIVSDINPAQFKAAMKIVKETVAQLDDECAAATDAQTIRNNIFDICVMIHVINAIQGGKPSKEADIFKIYIAGIVIRREYMAATYEYLEQLRPRVVIALIKQSEEGREILRLLEITRSYGTRSGRSAHFIAKIAVLRARADELNNGAVVALADRLIKDSV